MKYLFLFTALLLSSHAMCQDDVVKVGDEMPAFTIALSNGQTISSSILKGKVVLINFFATWCGPCRTELPLLQKNVWNKYQSNPDFNLLVIGREHSDAEVQDFKAKFHFMLPMYPDKSKDIYSLFATKYIPRNYIINKEGRIVYAASGYEYNEFQKMLTVLASLLKESSKQ